MIICFFVFCLELHRQKQPEAKIKQKVMKNNHGRKNTHLHITVRGGHFYSTDTTSTHKLHLFLMSQIQQAAASIPLRLSIGHVSMLASHRCCTSLLWISWSTTSHSCSVGRWTLSAVSPSLCSSIRTTCGVPQGSVSGPTLLLATVRPWSLNQV